MEYVDIKQLVGVEKPSFELDKAEYKSLESEHTVDEYKEALEAKKLALQASSVANKEMEVFLSVFFKTFYSSMHLDRSEAVATLMDEKSPIREVLLKLYDVDAGLEKKNKELIELIDSAVSSPSNLKKAMNAIEKTWELSFKTSRRTVSQLLDNVLLDVIVVLSEAEDEFFSKSFQQYRSVSSGVEAALRYNLAQLKLCLNIKLYFGVILASIPEARWDALPMLMLTKDVYVGLPSIKPKEPVSLKLSDVLPLTSEFDGAEISSRTLLPGAYIILGGPMSGKSLLINSLFDHLTRNTDAKTCLLHCMEPSTNEQQSLLTWSEISLGLSALLYCDKDVIAVDSLRFLNAASPYPAKRGGINSGLEIYATQLNELCVRANKIGFFIISTSDMSRQVTETYQALLVGSTQGIIVPGRINPDAFGKSTAPIEVSLRNGDRSYQFLTYTCVEPLRSMQSVKEDPDVVQQLTLDSSEDIYKNLLGE